MRAGLKGSLFLGHLARTLGLVGVTVVATAATSCNSIDTTRIAPPKATLGDDFYGVLCDRIGAGALTEDLTGSSYAAVCHYSSTGTYGDKVDTAYLPPVTGPEAEKARSLGIAKVEAMARRRSELVRAFNAIFPDVEIDNAATADTGDKIRLYDAMMTFSQSLSRLYESNPFEPQGTPTVPASTRALAEAFASLATSKESRDAFSAIWGRQGIAPFPWA